MPSGGTAAEVPPGPGSAGQRGFVVEGAEAGGMGDLPGAAAAAGAGHRRANEVPLVPSFPLGSICLCSGWHGASGRGRPPRARILSSHLGAGPGMGHRGWSRGRASPGLSERRCKGCSWDPTAPTMHGAVSRPTSSAGQWCRFPRGCKGTARQAEGGSVGMFVPLS